MATYSSAGIVSDATSGHIGILPSHRRFGRSGEAVSASRAAVAARDWMRKRGVAGQAEGGRLFPRRAHTWAHCPSMVRRGHRGVGIPQLTPDLADAPGRIAAVQSSSRSRPCVTWQSVILDLRFSSRTSRCSLLPIASDTSRACPFFASCPPREKNPIPPHASQWTLGKSLVEEWHVESPSDRTSLEDQCHEYRRRKHRRITSASPYRRQGSGPDVEAVRAFHLA